jgi:hypothetical protein
MTNLIPFSAGAVAAYLYFNESERGQDKTVNCSYLAPASTDVLAVAAGSYLGWYGAKNDAHVVSFIGATVLTIHALQWWHHKRNKS